MMSAHSFLDSLNGFSSFSIHYKLPSTCYMKSPFGAFDYHPRPNVVEKKYIVLRPRLGRPGQSSLEYSCTSKSL